MIKPSKVVFISDELEKDFNELKDDDPIKKGIIRAIRDLREKQLLIEGYKEMAKDSLKITEEWEEADLNWD